MSNFSTLEIGKRALIAQRFGLDVTGNNIANVNTPGYSRRLAKISETGPMVTPNGFIGTGAVADKLRTFREEFFDREIRNVLSRQSGLEIDQNIMRRIQSVLAEPTDLGLNELVSEFFNDFYGLSLKPEDLNLRDHILELGETMTERFHTIAYDISNLRGDAFVKISQNVETANLLLDEIAGLNSEIAGSLSYAQMEVQTFVDKRELALEELTKIANVTLGNGENGTVNVFINGVNLIAGGMATQLKVTEEVNQVTGERTVMVQSFNENAKVSTQINPISGELASLMEHYNITLDENDSSDGLSIIGAVNDFAKAIAENVNQITITGYGLNDAGPIPPGRAFFKPINGEVSAATMELSDEVYRNPEDIPLSDAPGEPGNSSIALQIASLTTYQDFLNNQTPSDYYVGIIGKLALSAAETERSLGTTEVVNQQLITQRESVMGVNLDEEAINLIKFQKAFEASSRVINVANEILSVLINLGR